VSDANIEIIDILPTIAHLMDLPLPGRLDGVSALDASQAPRPLKRLMGWGESKIVALDLISPGPCGKLSGAGGLCSIPAAVFRISAPSRRRSSGSIDPWENSLRLLMLMSRCRLRTYTSIVQSIPKDNIFP